MRSLTDICEAIANATPEEQGRIIAQIRDMDIPEDVKRDQVTFILMLSNLGRNFPRGGRRTSAN